MSRAEDGPFRLRAYAGKFGLQQSVLRRRAFLAGRLIRPIQEFVGTEALGGLALLLATACALLLANSPWDGRYFDLWAHELHIDLGLFALSLDVRHAVNDGLMTVFFFVVGLEIKRELIRGELASFRRAALPVAAALGGMVVPALVYAAWNAGGDGARGWGIPMATDIAFAVGVLALLGRRAPFALKVFLLGLAIVDDLGAIGVIVVFYTDSIAWVSVLWAVVVLGVVVALSWLGVRWVGVYVLLGLLLWVAMLESGIHATLAGVALAALTPHGAAFPSKACERSALGRMILHRGDRHAGEHDAMSEAERERERPSRDSEAPLDRLERILHPWTSFLIVPLFAFANAGVALTQPALRDAAGSPITFGVAMGLVLGKPAGIVLFAWLALRAGLASLPSGVRMLHIAGAGLVAGIGFTVSLFITELAFTDVAMVADAKIAILGASVVSGLLGFVYLWVAPGEPEAPMMPGDDPGALAEGGG